MDQQRRGGYGNRGGGRGGYGGRGGGYGRGGYYGNRDASTSKCIDIGAVGYLFTCDGIEKLAVREAYNLLNTFIDKHSTTTSDQKEEETVAAGGDISQHDSSMDSVGADADEDIADTLRRECAEMSAPPSRGGGRVRLLKQQPTGVKNCLFIASIGKENIGEIAHAMVKDVIDTGVASCRFLQRVQPVEITCRVSLADMTAAVTTLAEKHFPTNTDPVSFAIVFKSRNNDKLSRTVAIDAAAAAIAAHSPQSKVNLNEPDRVLCIDVVGKTMCLAVVDEYNQMRKYSLHPPAPPQQSTGDEAVPAE